MVANETRQLERSAGYASTEYENPASLSEDFENGLSREFWDFTIINGAGQVSNETAWHAAEMVIDHQLTLRHVPDPEFLNESTKRREPANERYNNVTLIGGSGFQPTSLEDVIVEFKGRVSRDFYGTAGVVLQPEGTLQADGLFVRPFDMFGLSIIGRESSFIGNHGPVCYLALNWAPAGVEALNVDPQLWHAYQIRLHWISKTQWQGTMSVDGVDLCQMTMPALGPMEIHVWSDNYRLTRTPKQVLEIDPSLDVSFQDGGEKSFFIDDIRIFTKER